MKPSIISQLSMHRTTVIPASIHVNLIYARSIESEVGPPEVGRFGKEIAKWQGRNNQKMLYPE